MYCASVICIKLNHYYIERMRDSEVHIRLCVLNTAKTLEHEVIRTKVVLI
jgi:hypothetical protein